MKSYYAGEELEHRLIEEGFYESTSDFQKKRGKKIFKLKKHSRSEILFDDENIQINTQSSVYYCGRIIAEEVLEFILIYFHLKPTELKLLGVYSKFNLDQLKQNLESLEQSLEIPQHLNNKKKLNKIISTCGEKSKDLTVGDIC